MEPLRKQSIDASPSPSRLSSLRGVQILGTGSCAGQLEVRNTDLAALGYRSEWIAQMTGIEARRHASENQATSDLAVEAARKCISASGVDRGEIDLVLVGTYTPDWLMPATANLVQHRLGLRAAAWDVQAACASFMFALATGMQAVASGSSRLALVIGADVNSRVVDPHDETSFPLFGDAAGAVLLAPGSADQGLLAYAAGSDGGGAEMLCRAGGTRDVASNDRAAPYLQMQGRAVFKWAVQILRETVPQVLTHAGLSLAEIDLAVFHQANLRIIDAAVKELGLPPDKVFNNIQRYGNTASASVPLGLDEARAAGRIRRGSRVLISGFGGGLAWGTAILAW